MYYILTPAYGRTYTRKADVIRDYNAGKDFIIQNVGPDCGRYANREDMANALATGIQIRYGKRLEKVCCI